MFERIGHIAVPYGKSVLIWGGYKESDEADFVDDHTKYYDPTEVDAYHPLITQCVTFDTTGDVPPANSGACGVVSGNYFYVFGGFLGDPDYSCNTNMLYRLDLESRKWKRLMPHGTEPLPCDKLFSWEYENKLYFFGGFGPPPVSDHEELRKFQLVPDRVQGGNLFIGRCWNNQLVEYDIAENSWRWPSFRGTSPSPRAAHAGFRCGSKVYIFGGRLSSQRMNDLHELDLESMTWSQKQVNGGSAVPCGRSWHSFSLVSTYAACLYGGFSSDNKPLGDLWIYDTRTNLWHEISNPEKEPRLWHQTVCIDGELIAVGGLQTDISNFFLAQVHAPNLLVVHFSPKTLRRLALESVVEFWDETSASVQSLPQNLKALVQLRKQSVHQSLNH